MKKLGVMVATLAMAGSTYAANMDYGTWTIHGNGLVNFRSLAGTHVDFEFGMGQFIADLIEVGGEAGIVDDNFTSAWRIGGYGEYNFVLNDPLFPYVGAKLSIAGADLKTTEIAQSNSGLELDLRAGIKYFLLEDLAIDSMVSFRLATDDIYANEDKPQSSDWRLVFGLRYFFDM